MPGNQLGTNVAEREKENSGSGVERRASERLAVDLAAQVDVDGRDPRSARIMDFCVGGLLLRVEGQEDDYLVMASRQIGRDDRLRVTFDVDSADGPQTFTITVKVARLFLGGMGVAFDPPNPQALRALQQLAERIRAATLGSDTSARTLPASGDAVHLLAEVQQRVQGWLGESLDAVFKQAGDDLFIEARDALNNDGQSAAMDALKDVERVHTSVRDAAAQRVLRALERLGDDSSSSSLTTIMDDAHDEDGGGSDGGLALIDSGSFDDWVTTKNIITRHEPTLREPAYALSRRLEVVTGKRIDELVNPLGLQQLASAFNEAMQNIGLTRHPRRVIYKAVEESLVPALGELHGELNAMLVDKGILPTVERPIPGTSKRSRSSRPSPAAALPASDAQDGSGAEAPVADSSYAQRGEGGSQGQYRPAAGGAGRPGSVDAPPDAPGAGPGRAAPQSASGGTGERDAPGAQSGSGVSFAAPESTYSADAQSAPTAPIHPSNANPPLQPQSQAPSQRPSAAQSASRPSYQSPIESAVSQVGMERAYQAARSLMSMQRAMTSGAVMAGARQPLAATPAQQQAGSPSPPLLDALSNMQSSPEFNQPSAPTAGQSTALRERLQAALQKNGVMLSADENEAVEVLGNLIEAVLGDPLIQANVKPRIQRLSVPLLRTAMQDQEFFEQDAHPARQVINRLGMLGLPDTLAEGQTGDSLQSSVDPILERMLADPQAGSDAFEAVLPELDTLIARQNQRYASNVSNIVNARERQQSMLAKRRADDTVVPRAVAPELEAWFQRTERLKVGDAVTFRAGSDNPQTRTLAWVADDHDTFVFADRDGRESGAVAQQELALDMLRGTAKIADSADVPAMDRGVYQMLHDIHRSLAEEGRRDSVTGLISLATFESRVQEAIGRAQRRGSRHALLALNLDGFANINKQCSRAAGDSLLRKLSRLLERQVAGQGCVTRGYADEFLILLEEHPFPDARRFAERQCRAIENSRVVFEGEQYPITASIGMVPVTHAGESAGAVIENARAALAGAKRRGGNRLRIFDPDEDEFPADTDRGPRDGEANADSVTDTHKKSADESAGDDQTLGDLLDNGCLVLQRQIVSPIDENSQARSHYEVLLGVRDAAGEVVAVSDDLLTEAERSERMVDVDRWVIRTTLKWMAANRRDVIRSGGYAIKLSAAAFANDSLLEYVVGELTESPVPPAKIIFEITESVAIDRLSSAVGFIRALREYGCRFSIDDFGAGHATFTYLKTLPVDFVNIDGMFVSDIADSDNDYAMVKSLNEIAHLMGKVTIAKFVDSDAAVARLQELEVDFFQGVSVGERETMQ